MRRLLVPLAALAVAGCAHFLPVQWSMIASDATTCAIALAEDASVLAQQPAASRIAVSPSIAGVLALLSTLDHLLPATIQACAPFVTDVQAEFSGAIVTPPPPTRSRPGKPNEPVPNPWKGILDSDSETYG